MKKSLGKPTVTKPSKNSRGISKPTREPTRKPPAPVKPAPVSKPTPAAPKATITALKTAAKTAAKLSPLSLTFRDLKPNWRSYVSYVAYAAEEGDEDMKRFMQILGGLPKKERDQVMPERLCELSGVKPSELVGAVAAQVWALQNGESAMAASMLHPEIVRKTAKAASNVKWGGRDRELFFRITGSLPDRKGTTIINNNNPQTAVLGSGAVAPGQLPSMDQAAMDMDRLLDPSPRMLTIEATKIESPAK